MQIDDTIFVNFISEIDQQEAGQQSFGVGDTPQANITSQQNERVNEIIANRGRIGGWIIENGVLRSGDFIINSDGFIDIGNGNLYIDGNNSLIRLGPLTGDYILLDGANQRMRSSNYAAGVSGFTVEPQLIEAQNIRARGVLQSATFQKDIISAIGGQLLVANADALDVDMTALDASTLTIKGDTEFAVNDIIRIKDGTDDEWMRVTNVASKPTYTVTRDLAEDYSADDNPVWTKGQAVVKHGESNGAAAYAGGWLQLIGEGTNSPYYSVLQRTGVDYDDFSEICRLGNLNGFLDYVAEIYGMGIGTASDHLKYDPSNGLRIVGTITGSTIQTATSGKRIRMLTNAGTTPTQLANSFALIDTDNNILASIGSSASAIVEITPVSDAVNGLNVINNADEYDSTLVLLQMIGAASTGECLDLQNAGVGHCLKLTNTGTGAHLELIPKATFSSSLSEGLIYADTDHKLYYYDGTEWLSMVEQGGEPSTALGSNSDSSYYNFQIPLGLPNISGNSIWQTVDIQYITAGTAYAHLDSDGNTWYAATKLPTFRQWNDTGKTVILESLVKITNAAGGDKHFGIAEQPAQFHQVYDNNNSGVTFAINNTTLYAKTADGSNHTLEEITGVTLTNWNLYKIEVDLGGSEARFYVNGDLKKTITTNIQNTANDLWVGFGGDTQLDDIFHGIPTVQMELD